MNLTEEQQKHYGKTLGNIEEVGWSVMLVSPGADEVIKQRQPLLFLDDPQKARAEDLEVRLRGMDVSSS